MLNVVETLQRLVAVPSINPMGRDLAGPHLYETALTDCLEQLFGQLGLPTFRQEVEPGRCNLLARLEGNQSRQDGAGILMFEAHQDTVPVDGMTIDPFDPVVQRRRVYGRGACDVKGGMACMLTVLSRLIEERPPEMPSIVMACTVNEEHGFTGAQALVELWRSGDCPLLPGAPQAAIVAEPTELNVVIAHKGVVRWKCHTEGRACHSSQPDRGENAIYKMANVVAAFQQYAKNPVRKLAHHPLLGSPTISVGTIHGGVSVNTVPDRCTIEVDRRLLPNEDPEKAYQHAVDYIDQHARVNPYPEHDPPYLSAPALPEVGNQELAQQLADIALQCGIHCYKLGVAYGTNASAYAAAHVPTVVFGPGSINQAHTKDEWIEILQLQRACEVLYQLACQGPNV